MSDQENGQGNKEENEVLKRLSENHPLGRWIGQELSVLRGKPKTLARCTICNNKKWKFMSPPKNSKVKICVACHEVIHTLLHASKGNSRVVDTKLKVYKTMQVAAEALREGAPDELMAEMLVFLLKQMMRMPATANKIKAWAAKL